MFKKALTTLTVLAAMAAAAPSFAHGGPKGNGAAAVPAVNTAPATGAEKAKGEPAVDTAKAAGEEKGKAKGEKLGRSVHQDKHRGADKPQDKHRGAKATKAEGTKQ